MSARKTLLTGGALALLAAFAAPGLRAQAAEADVPGEESSVVPAHVEVLVRLTEVEGAAVAKPLAEAIGRLEADWPESRPAVWSGIRESTPLVRAVCFRVLMAKADDEEAIRVGLTALGDRSQHVRLGVVGGLADSGRVLSAEEAEAVRRRLRVEPSAKVCKALASLLAAQGDEDAVPALVDRLEIERDERVRRTLVGALRSLTDRALSDDVEAWRSVANDIVESRRSLEIIESEERRGRR